MRLSIIVPVYNEEENIPLTTSRLVRVLGETPYSWELIFVDDGSQDNSYELLKKIKSEHENGASMRIVRLSRNFGQHAALAAGFSVAAGDVLITIDADGQIDPDHILPLCQKIQEGCDFVGGIRIGVGDSLIKRRFPSYVLNIFLGWATGKKLRDYGCPLNAMRLEIARKMSEYGDMQKFYKPLAVKLSRRVAEIEVRHGRRQMGRSKYRLLDLIDLFFDFVTNFSKRIFQRVVLSGIALIGAGTAAGLLYLFFRFVVPILQEPALRLQFVIWLGLVFGVQLTLLGVLGEFVVRIYRRTGKEPVYKIEEIV